MTPDERINDLIASAGSPVMVVKNTQEDELERRRGIYSETRKIIEEQFDDSVILYIRNLADTIDRLETALHNVINEREQLKRDLHYSTTYDWVLRSCHFCAHLDEPTNVTPCVTCLHDKGKPGFEWRGVPDKEE